MHTEINSTVKDAGSLAEHKMFQGPLSASKALLATLPGEPFYFPLTSRGYNVLPGLVPIETDMGNGPADGHYFQIDRNFSSFLDNKQARRGDGFEKHYYLTDRLSPEVEKAVTRFMIDTVTANHPLYFRLTGLDDAIILECRLTGEQIIWDKDLNFKAPLKYCSSIDALAMQIQEDLAVVERLNGADRISLLHVCAPNRWMPEEKIGRGYSEVHEPVPGMNRFAANAGKIIRGMIEKKPMVRFAWGLTPDRSLNQHSQDTPGYDFAELVSRSPGPDIYMRVERQTIFGFPRENAAIFTIRPYIYDLKTLSAEQRALIYTSYTGMSPESKGYKGLPDNPEILRAAILGADGSEPEIAGK